MVKCSFVVQSDIMDTRWYRLNQLERYFESTFSHPNVQVERVKNRSQQVLLLFAFCFAHVLSHIFPEFSQPSKSVETSLTEITPLDIEVIIYPSHVKIQKYLPDFNSLF